MALLRPVAHALKRTADQINTERRGERNRSRNILDFKDERGMWAGGSRDGPACSTNASGRRSSLKLKMLFAVITCPGNGNHEMRGRPNGLRPPWHMQTCLCCVTSVVMNFNPSSRTAYRQAVDDREPDALLSLCDAIHIQVLKLCSITNIWLLCYSEDV